MRWASVPTPIKLDPIWGYYCISDHNLIFIIYEDTHGQSWATLPNYRYNMLYWYNKKGLNISNNSLLGATKARGVGRERRGNVRCGCMPKLCVE